VLVYERKYATLLMASQPPVFCWLGAAPAGTWWRLAAASAFANAITQRVLGLRLSCVMTKLKILGSDTKSGQSLTAHVDDGVQLVHEDHGGLTLAANIRFGCACVSPRIHRRASKMRSLGGMRRSCLICRLVVLLVCGGVLAGPIAVAAAPAKPTVTSLRARRGAVTVRVSTPASVRLSIYEQVPAGCPNPYCTAQLVTATTQRVGRRGLTIEFGQALPRGKYLVVAVAVGNHGYVSPPRYAAVTVA
jgi:hypothetical protein